MPKKKSDGSKAKNSKPTPGVKNSVIRSGDMAGSPGKSIKRRKTAKWM
jgi:hypothetical protein